MRVRMKGGRARSPYGGATLIIIFPIPISRHALMSKYAPHTRSGNNPRATSSTVCQKCLGKGHFIYECKSTRPYVSRPSRTQQLAKTGPLDKAKLEGKPSVDLPDEFKTKTGTANKLLEAKEKERAKDKPGESSTNVKSGKRRRSVPSPSNSHSDSDSDSDSGSGSDSSSSGSDSDSSSGSSRSRSRSRTRSPAHKRRRGKSVSSADSGDSRRRSSARRRRYSSEELSGDDRRRR